MKITQPGVLYRKDIVVVLIAFAVSRSLSALCGIHLQYDAIYKYWQYLDTATLQHNLLQGLWYDHAQPPFFNLILGLVLKTSGSNSPIVFSVLLKCISLINCFLLLTILRQLMPYSPADQNLTKGGKLAQNAPLLIALVYLLSPGLIIFESELFYTTFISLLLLTSAFFILRTQNGRHPWRYAAGIFLPLAILCLTRSMYHLVWLIAISLCMLFIFKPTPAFKPVLTGALVSLLLVGGWYTKNYLIFGQFSTSSWLGMNLARTVFHDHPTTDSTDISTIEPFSDLRYYHGFVDMQAREKYTGLDNHDLLDSVKNDTLNNLNHVEYLGISKRYMTASTAYMKKHPVAYVKNAALSSIIFFAPATRYPYAEEPSARIKYYDLLYSFNLTHFAHTKGQRKIAMAASAIPKLIVYLCVFFLIGKDIIRRRTITPLNLFIICTIGYVFLTSSLVEHYENMRFRYEIEPLFLILLGQALLLTKPFKTIFNTSSALNHVLKS